MVGDTHDFVDDTLVCVEVKREAGVARRSFSLRCYIEQ